MATIEISCKTCNVIVQIDQSMFDISNIEHVYCSTCSIIQSLINHNIIEDNKQNIQNKDTEIDLLKNHITSLEENIKKLKYQLENELTMKQQLAKKFYINKAINDYQLDNIDPFQS